MFNSKSNRETQRNEVLKREIFEMNAMHAKFLNAVQMDKIEKKAKLDVNFREEYEQKPLFKTKQGECTFWDDL